MLPTRPTHLAAAFAVALASAAIAGSPATAQDATCLAPTQMHRAVLDGRALPYAQVRRLVEGATGGEILRAQLCDSGGVLTYALTVLHRGGQVVSMVVGASDGAYRRSEQIPRQPRVDRRDQVTGATKP